MTGPLPTPGQTVGPFFAYALPYAGGADLVPRSHPGAVRLHGRVLDGDGEPVPDALLELWQPDAEGRPVEQAGSLHRDGYTFTGWGRDATDRTGHYSFTTLVPGPTGPTGPGGPTGPTGPTGPGAAPFFALAVMARGLLDRLFTRAYLPDHAALEGDPFLASLDPERRRTLIAVRDPGGFAFDVRLQGAAETVFLRYRQR